MVNITTDQALFFLAVFGIPFVVSRIITVVGLLLEEFKSLTLFLKVVYGIVVVFLIIAAIIFVILIIQNPLKHHEENFSEMAHTFLLRFNIAAAVVLTTLFVVSNVYFLRKIKFFHISIKGVGLTFIPILLIGLIILWYKILNL